MAGQANLLTNISRAKTLTPEVKEDIKKLFTYKPWTEEEEKRGTTVRDTLCNATEVIVTNVPPGQTRDMIVLQMLNIRMQCNAAITFGGQC